MYLKKLRNESEFASVSHDKTINTWDVKNFSSVKTIKTECNSAWFLEILPNDDYVLACKDSVKIYDAKNQSLILNISKTSPTKT